MSASIAARLLSEPHNAEVVLRALPSVLGVADGGAQTAKGVQSSTPPPDLTLECVVLTLIAAIKPHLQDAVRRMLPSLLRAARCAHEYDAKSVGARVAHALAAHAGVLTHSALQADAAELADVDAPVNVGIEAALTDYEWAGVSTDPVTAVLRMLPQAAWQPDLASLLHAQCEGNDDALALLQYVCDVANQLRSVAMDADVVEAGALAAAAAHQLPLQQELVDVCGVRLRHRSCVEASPSAPACRDVAAARDSASAAATSTSSGRDELHVVLTESTASNVRRIASAMLVARASPHDMPPVLLEGPPGSGKTLAVRYVAQQCGFIQDMVEIHLDDVMDGKTLLGSYVCTDTPGEFAWQPGAITQAVQQGRWVLIEDIDRAPLEV
ncbi:MAG: AAA family ATPase, partial [Methanobacteriota archaeon]